MKYNIINSGNDNSDINSGYNLNKGQTPFIHHSPEINLSSSPEYNPNNIFYGNPMPYASSANNPSNINQNQNAVLPNNLMNNQFSFNDNKNIYSPISPVNPFFDGSDNNSQNYIQGTGGGIYNISPNLSDNGKGYHTRINKPNVAKGKTIYAQLGSIHATRNLAHRYPIINAGK